MADDERQRVRASESVGITLLGVIVSVGVTVGLGVTAGIWVRLLAGAGSAAALILVVFFLARPGSGPVSRLARWLLHTAPYRSGHSTGGH